LSFLRKQESRKSLACGFIVGSTISNKIMVMKIEQVVNEWFEATAYKINTNPKPAKPEYDLAANVLPLAHNYCNAVFILLDNCKKLPAMAILRVLGELVVRLIWCLYEDNPQ
jgi:hypothetical protein